MGIPKRLSTGVIPCTSRYRRSHGCTPSGHSFPARSNPLCLRRKAKVQLRRLQAELGQNGGTHSSCFSTPLGWCVSRAWKSRSLPTQSQQLYNQTVPSARGHFLHFPVQPDELTYQWQRNSRDPGIEYLNSLRQPSDTSGPSYSQSSIPRIDLTDFTQI